MERGHKLEDRARAAYELSQDVDVRQVGFVTLDDGSAGCSPDGLVGDDGGVEIKVASAETHAEYMLDSSRLISKYRLQIQGGMWICERQWWDIVSYNPDRYGTGEGMATVIRRVAREQDVIDKLAAAVAAFNEQLDAALIDKGYREPK
jgi:hypothetical protein